MRRAGKWHPVDSRQLRSGRLNRSSACSPRPPNTWSMPRSATFCSGRDAPARQPVPRAPAQTAPHVLDYEVELIVDGQDARATGQLCSREGRSAAGPGVDLHGGRSSLSSIRGPDMGPGSAASRPTARSASHSRPGIRAISSASCPTPCLAAIPSRTSHAPRRFSSKVAGSSHGRRQALRDRQLPGGMGGDDAGGHPPRAVRTHHRRRLAAVILGRRARKVSDALQRRPAGRQLVDRLAATSVKGSSTALGWCRIPKGPESGEHAVDQAVQPLFQDRYRGAALSGLRALVGRPRQPERGGDPVHRR